MKNHDKLVAQSVFWDLFREHIVVMENLRRSTPRPTAEIEQLWTRVRIDAERIDSFWPGLIASFNVKLEDWDGLWPYLSAVVDAFRGETDLVNRVFIGHGHSSAWLSLKAFIADELRLDWDEFNRDSPTGYTTIHRLTEMLDRARLAFLVMTAEDELQGAVRRPRSNVIHEAGLFQGRLGFNRAIILLEDGCDAFSNVEGLTCIVFPSGNINASFDEIARVLIREGFDLPAPKTLNVAFSAKLQTTSVSGLMRVVWPDSSLVFRTRGTVKAKGTIDGEAFEGNLYPTDNGAHELHILRYICEKAGKKEGDTVNVFVEERLP
jgi:hypothetical protein